MEEHPRITGTVLRDLALDTNHHDLRCGQFDEKREILISEHLVTNRISHLAKIADRMVKLATRRLGAPVRVVRAIVNLDAQWVHTSTTALTLYLVHVRLVGVDRVDGTWLVDLDEPRPVLGNGNTIGLDLHLFFSFPLFSKSSRMVSRIQ